MKLRMEKLEQKAGKEWQMSGSEYISRHSLDWGDCDS